MITRWLLLTLPLLLSVARLVLPLLAFDRRDAAGP
jgi:hypothetical protein